MLHQNVLEGLSLTSIFDIVYYFPAEMDHNQILSREKHTNFFYCIVSDKEKKNFFCFLLILLDERVTQKKISKRPPEVSMT
jgi:hypothetical protein